jgi:hypothetical protein
VAERYADGQADSKALLKARARARDYRGRKRPLPPGIPQLTWPAQLAAVPGAWDAALWTLRDCADTAWLLARDSNPYDTRQAPSHTGERRRHADLVHELFGNPFRKATLDPAWLSWQEGVVSRLAGTIYDERAFDRLPVLADALEDAGCTDRTILDHCRGPGPHVRGCWVVDLLLGKG